MHPRIDERRQAVEAHRIEDLISHLQATSRMISDFAARHELRSKDLLESSSRCEALASQMSPDLPLHEFSALTTQFHDAAALVLREIQEAASK
jgi:hypothetical protein